MTTLTKIANAESVTVIISFVFLQIKILFLGHMFNSKN